MVAVVVPAPVVLDQTVSTSAAKVAPVVLAVLVYRIQFVVPHNFSVVEVAVAEHHQETRVRQMALVAQVEAAWVDLVEVVPASCRLQVLRILDLVAVAVVGETPTLVHNALALQVQMELLYFRIQRQQQVFQVSQ
jgi:hypothetical protein